MFKKERCARFQQKKRIKSMVAGTRQSFSDKLSGFLEIKELCLNSVIDFALLS